jgi:UPF0755 protein
MNAFTLFRNLRNGKQDPLNLVISEVRTREKLADIIVPNLIMSKEELMRYLNNNDSLAFLGEGIDTCTVIALFMPYTYEVYWNISPRKLLKKMQESHKAFWNDERKAKAKSIGLTPAKVSILASIVQGESNHTPEYTKIAGVYVNRLRKGMRLQACPTVAYCFDYKPDRILDKHLKVNSPYNTYKHAGLPPGPICSPSKAALDAVLNADTASGYLYFCASPAFDGTNVFSKSYKEHMVKARAYQSALDALKKK